MKKRYIAVAISIVVIAMVGAWVWASYVDSLNAVKHDTNRWAVIEDVNGDRMAVEPTSDQIWSELVQLNQNGSSRMVGGIVEIYDNKWGFRFKPESVTVAEATAEGLQGTIQYISTHIDDWLDGWAYISSKVVEVHS